MENKQYRPRCSMTPLIYSIVPIGFVSFIVIVHFAFPRFLRWEGGCFVGTWNLFPCCMLPLTALVAVPMGIFSILSGMAEIRVPYGKGKTLVVVAIVFGILDIAIGAGFLWYLSKVFSGFF